MVSNKRDVIPFLVENAKHLRMDIAPLEKLVREHADEGRIRASGLELGVMTFRVPQLQGVPMRLKDMKPGSLGDWVIASASCFPVFPSRQIDGQRYIDGGYYDNLPIDMALADGADEVIAVELRPEHIHPEYARLPWLKVVKPRHSLGGFLDFNPRLMGRSLRLGFQDTMKLYRRFDGFLYTFQPVNALEVTEVARRYLKRINAFDAEFMRRGALYAGQPVNAPMVAALEAETDFEPLDWKAVWLRGLEICMAVMGYRVDAVYDAARVIGQLRAFAEAQPSPEKLDDAATHEARRAGSRQLFARLSNWLDGHGDFPADQLRRLGESPRETAAALFMHTLKVMNA